MHWVQILDRVYAECRLPPGTLYTRPLQHTDKRTSSMRPSSGLGRLRYGAPDLPTCPIQGILGPHQEESGRFEPRPQPLSRIFAASRTPRWPGSLGYIVTPWRSTWPSRPHQEAALHEESQRPCALRGLTSWGAGSRTVATLHESGRRLLTGFSGAYQ